jgi:hypothetical protein
MAKKEETAKLSPQSVPEDLSEQTETSSDKLEHSSKKAFQR